LPEIRAIIQLNVRNAVGPGCRPVKSVTAVEALCVSIVMAVGMLIFAKNAEEKGLFYVVVAAEVEFIVTKLALTAKKRVVLSAQLVEEPVGDDEF
jgi:hypothetical protein